MDIARLRALFAETDRTVGRDAAILAVIDAARVVSARARDVIAEVAREHEVTPEQVMGRSVHRHVVRARWAAMARLREAGLSYPRIGRILGRDHSTVMYGIRRHAGLAAHVENK